MKQLAIALLMLFSVAHAGDASVEESTIAKIEAGKDQRAFRTAAASIGIPDGCSYLSHDVEVLDMVPDRRADPAERETMIRDYLVRDIEPSGKVTVVVVVVQARNTGALARVVVKARLKTRMSCVSE